MPLQGLNTGLIFTNSNCIGCNKCISGCHAPGANVVVKEKDSNKYTIAVNPNNCILCGGCLTDCLHDARTYKDDTDSFFEALKNGEHISILVAPSLLSDYEEQYNNILGYLKDLGVRHIYNTSFGADIMVWVYINLIQSHGLKSAISQFCPIIVNYCEKYNPELLPSLMPVQSPMMCTAIYARDYLNITDKLAYISPCIASKYEMDDVNTYGKVSYNVTFERLMDHLKGTDITPFYAEDEAAYGLGGLISMSGGLSDNIELYVGFDEVLIQITGSNNIFPYFEHYNKEVHTQGELPFLVDALNCTNGCNFGSGTNCGIEFQNKMAFSAHRAKEKVYKSGIVPIGSNYSERINKLNKRFENLELCSFIRQYDLTRKIEQVTLSEETIDHVFISMYKYTEEQRHTDCGSCGHRTCYHMACATGANINHKENCINYSKERIRLETEKTNRLLDEISAINEELRNSAQLKSNFLANMSHEIRTPMNAVIGMAEMALRGNLPNEERSYIQQIKASGRSLLAIINDVLDFSKIESGKMEINEVEYAVMSIINDTVNMVMSRISEKDITLIVEADPEIPFILYGDDIRIKQVLTNFASNAIKFTASGSVKISMHHTRNNDTITLSISIQDTGIGIKDDDLGKIFSSFQQVDSTRNRNIEGTGLGLAISKEIVHMMGGEIHVKSIYGKGSTFSFCIPQKIVNDTPSVTICKEGIIHLASCINNRYVRESFEFAIAKFQTVDIKCSFLADIEEAVANGVEFVFIDYPLWNKKMKEFAKKSKNTQFIIIVDPRKDIVPESYVRKLNQPVYSLSIAAIFNNESEKDFQNISATGDIRFVAPDAQILIVDDNIINLTVAKGLLSPIGMNITCASGALEAIYLIENNHYDLVFMDHMMPDIDGVEATHMIRKKEGDYFKNLPIIALTANAINDAKKMFLREGMDDFVAKPIEMLDIISKLRKWLPKEKIKSLGLNEIKPVPQNEFEIPEITGLDVKVGLSLSGNWEFYTKILSDYYAVIEKKVNLIETYVANENILNYTIEVHALKSSSRTIGATALGDLAAKLEKYGLEKEINLIKELTPELLVLYRSYIPILKPFFQPDIIEAIHDITPIKLKEKLTLLCDALDSFDIDSAKEVVNELQSFRFEQEEQEILKKLCVSVKNLEYEEAFFLGKKWIEFSSE